MAAVVGGALDRSRAHAAVTGLPLLTRDPRHVATYIPGAALISP
jgi:hypothetical protein